MNDAADADFVLFDEGDTDPRLTGDDLETVLQRHRPRQQTALQTFGVVAALLALTVGLWRFFQPQPATVTIIPAGFLYVVSPIGYGTLTINGVAQPFDHASVYPLRAGLNTIQLNAPPFPPQRCVLHWPAAPRDTCQLVAPPGIAQATISFPLSLDDLSAADRDHLLDLTTTLEAHLAATLTTPLATGDSYARLNADGMPETATAATPLTATLAVSPDPAHALCEQALCPYAGANGALGLRLTFTAHWDYRDALGAVIDRSPDLASNILLFLGVRYADLGWRIAGALPIDGPADDMAQTEAFFTTQMIQAVCQAQGQTLGVMIDQRGVELTNLRASLTGCLYQAQRVNGSGDTIGAGGLFLERFGVLFAGDDLAGALLPALPHATEAELAAVRG